MLYMPGAKGQGLVEYALIIVFVAIVILAALASFSGVLLALYNRIVTIYVNSVQ